jgi:hypothetical protein
MAAQNQLGEGDHRQAQLTKSMQMQQHALSFAEENVERTRSAHQYIQKPGAIRGMIRMLRASLVFDRLKSTMLSRTSLKAKVASLAQRARHEKDITYPVEAAAQGSVPLKRLEECSDMAESAWPELVGIEEECSDFVKRWKLGSRAGAHIFQLNLLEETRFPHRGCMVSDEDALAAMLVEAKYCPKRLDDATLAHVTEYNTEEAFKSGKARAIREANALVVDDHSQVIEKAHAHAKRASRTSEDTHAATIIKSSSLKAIQAIRCSETCGTSVQDAIDQSIRTASVLSGPAQRPEQLECASAKGKNNKLKRIVESARGW